MSTVNITPGMKTGNGNIGSAEQRLAQHSAEWSASKDRVLDDFRALVSDSEELLRSTAGLSGDAVTAARGRFEKQWMQAKARLDEAQMYARERGRQAVTVADDYVNDHPWRAAGIAGGVGVLIGLLMSRRS